MATVSVELGPELFSFSCIDDWIAGGPGIWRQHDVHGHSVGHVRALAIDAAGRICMCGGHFMRARDEATYPIRVYRIEDPWRANDVPTTGEGE